MLNINCMGRVQSVIMIIVLVLGVGMFYGCGTKTTVVLLPEPDGSVGQVTVSGQDQSRLVLGNAFESASVGKPGRRFGIWVSWMSIVLRKYLAVPWRPSRKW